MATADGTLNETRSLQISSKMSVGRASLLMAGMIALSRLTGFGRLMLTSHLYGISPMTDAYNAAFNIPDTISIIIAGGALATGFVPVFTEYLAQGQEEAARRTFRAMFTLLGVAFGVITLVLLLLTFTPFGALLAPRKVDPQYIALYLRMLRILLVAQFFFVLGGMFSGTLNALRLFIYPALQPVMFNCGIIIFGILLPYSLGMGIESQAWGALAGALVGSLAIQMPAIMRNGLTLSPLWDLEDKGVRRVLASLLPIVFGLASGQIIGLNLPRFFAIGLQPGDLTALDNANRLMQVPLDLLASGPAIALFPTLSLLSARGELGSLRVQLTAAFRRTILLTMAASALLMALAFPVIHLLLEHGHFDKADTKYTASVLWFYGLCIVGLGAQQMLARGFYALQDTRTPVIIGLGAMLVFAVAGAFLTYMTPLGAPGLALAAAIAVTVLGLWMWVELSGKLGGWDDGATIAVAWRGLLGAIVAYYAALWLARLGIQFITQAGLDSQTTLSALKLLARTVVLVVAGAGGGAAFVAVITVLQVKLNGNFRGRIRYRSRVFSEFNM